jgi:hypothetical protein
MAGVRAGEFGLADDRPWASTTLMLSHHLGAKSGTERVTPLGCFPGATAAL